MDTFHLPKVGPNSSLVLVNSNSRRFEGNKIFYKVLPLGEKKLNHIFKSWKLHVQVKRKCFFCCWHKRGKICLHEESILRLLDSIHWNSTKETQETLQWAEPLQSSSVILHTFRINMCLNISLTFTGCKSTPYISNHLILSRYINSATDGTIFLEWKKIIVFDKEFSLLAVFYLLKNKPQEWRVTSTKDKPSC